MPTTPANDAMPGGDQMAARSRSTRREFIKRSAHALGAGVTTLVIYGIAESAQESAPTMQPQDTGTRGYDWTRHQYVYLIDTRKCIGCGACVRACAQENSVPLHYFRTWVERYQIPRSGEALVDSPEGAMNGFDPSVNGQDVTKAFFFPKLCNQCTFTPCVQLCPVGASYRTRDGVILVDEQRCIGCGYCVQGCPYGTRFIHPETHTASKCTLCYHRITRGLKPACVQACPVGARMLGDTKQVGDEVARIIATERVQVLQPELLTEPNCFYLGLSREAR